MTTKTLAFLALIPIGLCLGCGTHATQQPASTLTSSLSVTPTSTLSFSPTSPAPAGWRYYSESNFEVALPQGWQVVEIEKQGLAPVQELAKSKLPADLAAGISADISSGKAQRTSKLWAIDPQPAGSGYAFIMVGFLTLSNVTTADKLCADMQAQQPSGVIDSQCGLVFNHVEAMRFTERIQADSSVTRQYLNVYLKDGNRTWVLTSVADESVWLNYEPTFNTVAELFRPE
jgi:hypothetical protein